MNEKQVAAMLTWLSQVDGRIEANKPTAELWAYAVGAYGPDEVKAAILEHYRRDERAVPTPAGIRRMAAGMRETNAARQQAVEAPRAAEASDGWAHKSIKQRIRNTPEFQALFEEGRREGNAERARNMEARNAA